MAIIHTATTGQSNAFQPTQENLVFNYPMQGASPHRFARLSPAPLPHRDPAPMACAPMQPAPVGPAPMESAPRVQVPTPLASMESASVQPEVDCLDLHCTALQVLALQDRSASAAMMWA